MLRINIENGPLATRMKLEGKLAHEWVAEAENAWISLRISSGDKTVVVDLFDVSFVDDAGGQLLAQMRHAGAKLVGAGPMMSALIEEIEEMEAAQAEEASAAAWQKSQESEEGLN
jgi:anti-anti-sigma regulatory factor